MTQEIDYLLHELEPIVGQNKSCVDLINPTTKEVLRVPRIGADSSSSPHPISIARPLLCRVTLPQF